MNTVLIVDDDPYVRKLLEVTLSVSFKVVQTENPEDVIDMIVQLKPCAVFLDVLLPNGMTGIELLKTIKSKPETRDVPIALVTVKAQRADWELGVTMGADAYFKKPFSPLELLAWARKYGP